MLDPVVKLTSPKYIVSSPTNIKIVYPLIGVGEGQNFGLSYTQLMTMDLLQYDVSMTEILHTTCSKHVVVDGKGLVSMRPSHVYFWMCMKQVFKKHKKTMIILNISLILPAFLF